MTIRAKLALGLFSIALVLLVPLGFTLVKINRMHRAVSALQTNDFAASLLLGRLGTALENVRRGEVAMNVVGDSATYRAFRERLALGESTADSLRAFGLAAQGAVIRQSIEQVAASAPAEFEQVLAQRGNLADSISRALMAPALQRADSALRSGQVDLRERTRVRVQAAAAMAEEASSGALVAFLVASVLALLVAILLYRSIARPVRALEAGMAAVADGNFRHQLGVSTDRRDEFGRLAQSFQSMAEQLSALDKLKAEFISIASHELKTPINVILGYVQLIEEGAYGEVNPRQEGILKTVENQTRSLARLVQQLLDVSRFEAGGGKLDLRAVPLARFLSDLQSTFVVLSMQKEIDFQVHAGDGLPDEVIWDPDRVNEVLGNLLSNAFKFTGRGGSVELSAEASGTDVHFTVRDTGAGIPPEQLPHVFEKFYQANNQKSASLPGTGLGLAIARQIVMAHNGTIAVDSTVGVGTTFTIALPARSSGRPSVQQRRMTSAGAVPAGVS